MSQRLCAYPVALHPHTMPSRVTLSVTAFLVTSSFSATSSATSIVVIAVILIVIGHRSPVTGHQSAPASAGQRHQTGFVTSHQLT